MSNPIQNRYDFTILFDVKNGNPNGDPDADNMPRIDPQTEHGIVTDVAIKRKIRDYVLLSKENKPPYSIYIQSDNVLENVDTQARKDKPDDMTTAAYMCSVYYDIRTFGAVMASLLKRDTKDSGPSHVRGPVQLAFAESIDPIYPREIAITREALSTADRKSKSDNDMGRKYIVPYGLYRVNGFINPLLAEGARGTGFSEDDLALLWKAIVNLFELDHSAARGEMNVRKLYIFKHSSKLGDTQSYRLFNTIHIDHNEGVTQPQQFEDYTFSVDTKTLDRIAPHVELSEKIDDQVLHAAR